MERGEDRQSEEAGERTAGHDKARRGRAEEDEEGLGKAGHRKAGQGWARQGRGSN